MESRITDSAIAELIASLPYYSLPREFNRKVLAELGLGARAALPRRWKLWAERAVGTAAACWLGAAVFSVLFLASAHLDDLLLVLLKPSMLLSGLKFYALKAGFIVMDVLRLLNIAKDLLMIRAGGQNLLPYLGVSTILAGSVILALSRHPVYTRSDAVRSLRRVT
ncbi:MAG: hypothetical protein KKH28_05730 [Elusimicrobia bacterium]|nr:hypothetical protein [Elusimicrobiota bacterium]